MCERQPLDPRHIKRILKFDHSCSVSHFSTYLVLDTHTRTCMCVYIHVHTHACCMLTPFQHVWLGALTLGQPYCFPGTAVLSAGCQARDWQNPKKLGPDASFTVYRNVSAVISWRPSLEIQTDTLMKAL